MYSGNTLFNYVVDTEKKTITGGCFGSSVRPYKKLVSMEKGGPLVVDFSDGRYLATGPIISCS